jgi:uncharacterized protein (TIGR02453 family)
MKLSKTTFRFLIDLESNNNRDWFNENKPRFLEAMADFTAFIDHLITQIAEFDDSIKDVKAKDCVFRIYRDVRFSKVKTPYKSFFSAYIAESGRKSTQPGFYVHLDPTTPFFAGGKYTVEPDELLKIRTQIAEKFDSIENIFSEAKFKTAYGEMSREFALKTAPKGFPKDHVAIELLKLKSFIVSKTSTEKEICDTDFLTENARTMKPFLNFLRDSLDK